LFTDGGVQCRAAVVVCCVDDGAVAAGGLEERLQQRQVVAAHGTHEARGDGGSAVPGAVAAERRAGSREARHDGAMVPMARQHQRRAARLVHAAPTCMPIGLANVQQLLTAEAAEQDGCEPLK